MQETRVQSLGWENTLEKELATHSSTLAWKNPMNGGAWLYTPWGCKELDTKERLHFHFTFTFPGSSVTKDLPAMQETWVLSLGLEQCPREGNGNPLLYHCLGNPMDRGAWQATVHGVSRVK